MFFIHTDGSNVVRENLLSHGQEGQERVLACWSKKYSKAAKNYRVTKREVLTIVKTSKHFNKYLYGQEIHPHTGHYGLA
jgi:hypothetical protein